MTGEEFERIFDQMVSQNRKVLVEKAREYADDTDRLHNFKAAAALIGGTPEQALWGFAVKHLVSISDMVADGQDHPSAMWEEKLGDAFNYLVLLAAQVQETKSQLSSAATTEGA